MEFRNLLAQTIVQFLCAMRALPLSPGWVNRLSFCRYFRSLWNHQFLQVIFDSSNWCSDNSLMVTADLLSNWHKLLSLHDDVRIMQWCTNVFVIIVRVYTYHHVNSFDNKISFYNLLRYNGSEGRQMNWVTTLISNQQSSNTAAGYLHHRTVILPLGGHVAYAGKYLKVYWNLKKTMLPPQDSSVLRTTWKSSARLHWPCTMSIVSWKAFFETRPRSRNHPINTGSSGQ